MESNHSSYESFAGDYNDYFLYPPERALLEYFRNTWGQLKVLDIGIGTGRTTFTLSAICEQYTGIDYSSEMVEVCRARIPETDHAKYVTCDARDLSAFYGSDFDLVIFSLNGIDSVDYDDRTRIIEEVRKVISPDGVFFFSSHLIGNFSVKAPLPVRGRERFPRFVYRYLNQVLVNVKMAWIYRSRSVNEIRNRSWAILRTPDHNFTMSIFHTNPEFQVAALEELGFRTDAIINPSGNQVSAIEADSPWCYFLATAT